MIVKEFLLSLDFEKLHKHYYATHILPKIELIETANRQDKDLAEYIRKMLSNLRAQIADIQAEKNPEEYLLVMKHSDFDYTDDLEMFRTEGYHAFYIKKDECEKHFRYSPVISIEEAQRLPHPWTAYGLTFLPWDKILGMEIAYLPDSEYDSAVAIIEEMTFFGFDRAECEETITEEVTKLDEVIKEVESGNANLASVNIEELRVEFGLPEDSPEKKAREDLLSRQILVENLNETYRVYNILLDKGFFN